MKFVQWNMRQIIFQFFSNFKFSGRKSLKYGDYKQKTEGRRGILARIQPEKSRRMANKEKKSAERGTHKHP